MVVAISRYNESNELFGLPLPGDLLRYVFSASPPLKSHVKTGDRHNSRKSLSRDRASNLTEILIE